MPKILSRLGCATDFAGVAYNAPQSTPRSYSRLGTENREKTASWSLRGWTPLGMVGMMFAYKTDEHKCRVSDSSVTISPLATQLMSPSAQRPVSLF